MGNSIGTLVVLSLFVWFALGCDAADPQTDPLEAANKAFEAKEYTRALELYSAALKTDLDAPTKAMLIFNAALTHKAVGQFDEAIKAFSQVCTTGADDKEPGGHIMEAYRNYRPRAQWEIGNCLFAQKKYREALKAYQATETNYPFQSWCGNEQAEYRHRYAFCQGLCHDWLGETASAVCLYFRAISDSAGLYSNPTAHLRIVDIYEAGNQETDLESLLQKMDREHLAKMKGQLLRESLPSDEEILKWSPTKTIRSILKLREMGTAKDWGGLVGLVKIKGTVAGPDEAYARRGNWEATEAARMLSTHAEETVPLLIARLEHADRQDVKWLYYALGRCGTEQAVAALKSNAVKETNCWWTNAVVYALSLAGEKGDAVLTDLEEKAEGNLKGSITRYRQGKIGDRDEDVQFPALRGVPRLPAAPEELKIAQPALPADAGKPRR
jgi:tetratricopeptide (TPR) repeat protein